MRWPPESISMLLYANASQCKKCNPCSSISRLKPQRHSIEIVVTRLEVLSATASRALMRVSSFCYFICLSSLFRLLGFLLLLLHILLQHQRKDYHEEDVARVFVLEYISKVVRPPISRSFKSQRSPLFAETEEEMEEQDFEIRDGVMEGKGHSPPQTDNRKQRKGTMSQETHLSSSPLSTLPKILIENPGNFNAKSLKSKYGLKKSPP